MHARACREAGLAPYKPELQFTPQLYVNYNQTVGRLRRIYSTPSGLESTSLVLACGLGNNTVFTHNPQWCKFYFPFQICISLAFYRQNSLIFSLLTLTTT